MRALVIGAALSGTAAAKLLAAKGYEVYLTDLKAITDAAALEKKGIKVYEKGHPDFLKTLAYDLICKNPGIRNDTPFVHYFLEKGYRLWNEIDVALKYADQYSFAAVTGTNGKTTTTTLLGEFLKNENSLNTAAGNIGQPLAEVVLKNGNRPLKVALELSSFQLSLLRDLHPRVSAILNLTPDHCDYHGNAENYYRAKVKIYQNQKADDWFLFNIDDENIRRYAQNIPCHTVTFSLKGKADLMIVNDEVRLFNQTLFKLNDLLLPGRHNLENAMVAAAMAYKMGITGEDIVKTLRSFKGVAHRLEFIREYQGVKYYNDSKGTNPEATAVALNAFADNVILLAGGYDKKTGFKSIIPYLHHVKKMYVFGETKEEIKALYPKATVCERMEDALIQAKESAEKGDVILLSPMCASWDQYRNFEERGEIFADIVRKF